MAAYSLLRKAPIVPKRPWLGNTGVRIEDRMACLVKAPSADAKGCVTFTTQERDHLINKNLETRARVERLKERYLVGLHHNWHDYQFKYDPLFDFSLAGDGDLIERQGVQFPCIHLDACNFAPPSFDAQRRGVPFWDVLCTSRAVFFKGIPDFLQAIREIYDSGRMVRVLHLCPVPPAANDGTTLHDIRDRFESLFNSAERRYFNLITMEWDNPFPLDLDTLAFFYRSCSIYVHSAPDERRARAAAYAWATGIPLVSRENVASILPKSLRREPFWFEFDDAKQMAASILRALDAPKSDPEWAAVSDEFATGASSARLEKALGKLASEKCASLSQNPINPINFDIRLGRHHSIGGGTNQVDQNLGELCRLLLELPAETLQEISCTADPEQHLAALGAPASKADAAPAHASVPPFPLQSLAAGVRRLLKMG